MENNKNSNIKTEMKLNTKANIKIYNIPIKNTTSSPGTSFNENNLKTNSLKSNQSNDNSVEQDSTRIDLKNEVYKKTTAKVSKSRIKKRHSKLHLIYYIFYFFLGGMLYASIELLWRGRTHWTMILLGGIVMALLYHFIVNLKDAPLIPLAVFGAVSITALELLFGIIINRKYELAVWSYNGIDHNILGQICPIYSFFWFLLCIPAILLIKRTMHIFYKSKLKVVK